MRSHTYENDMDLAMDLLKLLEQVEGRVRASRRPYSALRRCRVGLVKGGNAEAKDK